MLLFGNGGLLGDAVTALIKGLFGRGAWAMPIVIGFAGAMMIAGKSVGQAGKVTTGSILIFLGVLGFFAKPFNGDYFDPSVLSSSGGYFGAVVAWGVAGLLGSAMAIGLGVIIALGVILCVEKPIRELIASQPKPELEEETEKPEKPSKPKPRIFDSEEDQPPQKPRPAVRLAHPALADENPTPQPQPTSKKAPKFTEETAPALQIEATPKEGYTLPPLSLLTEPIGKVKRSPQEMQKNIETLETTLEQFNIEANVVEVATGPTITRYEIQLAPGIRVNRITSLADNIAMSMAASHVRVEAPIPGKSAIGVEVPNSARSMVTLREMCESLEFHDNQSKLTVALGKDVAGVNKYTDLTKMPHLLIGGATNSGKSIGLSTIIMSLILKSTPKEVRLVMIDPKRVELTLFEGLPHLMCPVVKDVKESAGVLRAVWREMDRRYDMFSERQVRNIEGWNAKATYAEKLPFIVVIIDELADLMIQCKAEVETSICRLAQLARATGIHLVIATQRPSVDVITGTIKANIASRISFSVSSQIDSRTILDAAGAEKLIGRGDMLFQPIDASKPVRIQGCYVSEKEIEEVCHFWRQQEKPQYVINPVEVAIQDKEGRMKDSEESDDLWEDAVRHVVERNSASTSMLQRRFSIGFQRASRLLDMMEERGVVGPRDGPRPREILIDPIQMEQMFGRTEYYAPLPEGEYIGDDD